MEMTDDQRRMFLDYLLFLRVRLEHWANMAGIDTEETGELCLTPLKPVEPVEPVIIPDTDEILDIKGCARYMNVSENWIHKHSHELPRIQAGKRGRLRFRRSEIDKYLKRYSTPGIRD